MKTLKRFVCLALSVTMIFSLAACGGTFDGNYKEVTGEEYNTTVADVQAAFGKGGIDGLLSPKTENSKTIRLAAANEAAASGAKAEYKSSLGYKNSKTGAEAKLDTKSSEEVCVNDGKVEAAVKSDLKVKSKAGDKSIDSTLKTEAYAKDGDFYLGVKAENKGDKEFEPTDKKLKFSTALTGAIGVDVNSVVSFGMLNEYAESIVMESADELNKAGVKVYMDNSGDTIKVKYVVDLKAYGDLGIGTEHASYDLKDCYVIVVLNKNKGLVGVKVKLDVTAKRDFETIVTKVEGSVEKTDKGVKFPALGKYEEATPESGMGLLKDLTEFAFSIAGSVGDYFD